MILKKVKIQNYRQYRDMEVEFASDTQKNFTIIKGNNGTGKTTLLNALTWCLYGSEIHSYGQYTGLTLCNNKAANLAEDGEEIDVSVEMEFIDDKNKLLKFKRTLPFYKKGDTIKQRGFNSTLEVTRQKGNDYIITEDDYYTVHRTIPKKIEEYFFFDGARLGDYFQHNTNQNIKDSVYEISQLNYLDSLADNLDKVLKKYISKQKKVSPLGDLNDHIAFCENSLKEYKKDLEEANRKIESAELEIKQVNEELISKNAVNVKADVEKDKKLVKDIERINIKLYGKDGNKGLVGKRKKLILETYPLMMAYKSFNKFLEYGEDYREKQFIPPKYKKGFLKDLLDEGTCICGTKLSEDSEHREAILKLFEETNPITDKSEEVTSNLTHIREFIIGNILKNFKKRSLDYNRQIRDYIKDLDEKHAERQRIKTNLENNPIKEINVLQEIKTDLESQIRIQERSIGSLESKIRSTERDLTKWQSEYKKQASLQEKAALIDKKIEFTKDAKTGANDIYKTLSAKLRKDIEKFTKEKFVKVQWKEDEFVDINLNMNYDISITNKTGDIEKPGDLSDGEKLCLGLCFMSALHDISGFNLPTIMDTPLGNLDVDIRQNIAKFLPEFAEGRQIVLLVTGTEYTDDFKDILQDNIGKEYKIEWDNSENGKESKVVLNG